MVVVRNGKPGGLGGFWEVLGFEVKGRWKSQKNLCAAVKSVCPQCLLGEKKKQQLAEQQDWFSCIIPKT